MILIFKTIILGIVEGLTEFVPVSSTAHILITSKVLGMATTPFVEALSICIQTGAILAAVWYFWRLVWKHLSLIPKVIVGFIPTGIAGLLLYPIIKSFLGSTHIIAAALILGGIGLLMIKPRDEAVAITEVTYKQAFWIGIAQIASMVPGVSRAGATLIGGTLLRIPRATIVAFSFLLAIPTILGASVVEIRHVSGITGHEWLIIALGGLVAFITALLTIRFFMNLMTKKPLSWFGWYRILLGLIIFLSIK